MPNTIAENLQRLVNAKNAIANAITAKGGTVISGDGLEDFASDIATIPSGGNTTKSDVNFYDYDGTIVQSYTKQEFLALESMPANPTHEGLTAQGWNWELVAAKAHVEAYGNLNIGQMYVTSDGKTRIYVHMEDGRLNPQLNLTFAETGSFTVDWGDGTTPDTINGDEGTIGTIAHTYMDPGDYVVAVAVNSGKVYIIGNDGYTQLFKKADKTNSENRVYGDCVRAIKLGSGVISIGDYAFLACYSLISITIPNSVESIGNHAFESCSGLKSVTIPSGVKSIEAYVYNSCRSLISIMIPNSVKSIGSQAFRYCTSLTSITIPDSVESIGGNAFQACYSLTSITIPSGVKSIEGYVFNDCYSIKSIIIPDSVESIGTYAFQNCFSLTSITISSRVKSIEYHAFGGCYSLVSITIPDSVKNIKNYAFENCYGLGYLKFTSNTPPTLVAKSVFANIPTDCIIYVPAGKLSVYKTAQNYPSSSTYTYQEYTEA